MLAQETHHIILISLLCPLQDDIYMFGGKLEAGSGNVTDELWLFDTRSRSWSLRTPSPGLQVQPFAVEGHTAHIVDNRNGEPIMVVLLAIHPFTATSALSRSTTFVSADMCLEIDSGLHY